MLQATRKIGWIGTGVMGKSMCKHLLKAGKELSIFSRTQSKTEELIQMGAKFITPKRRHLIGYLEIAEECDLIFLMLGYPQDLEDLLLGNEGIIQFMKPGSILVDHTTSSPALATLIAKKAEEGGVSCLDAPVSGGDIGAQKGELVVMVGGPEESFNLALPYIDVYSKKVQRMGDVGKGQHTKMANQIIISTNMIGVVEGLLYAHKAGLELPEVIGLLSGGAAGSFSLCAYGPRMLKRDFEPGFYVEHFVKDLGIALEEGKRMNLSLPGLALAHQFYVSLMANGGGRNGTQALLKTFELINNIQIPKHQI